MSDSIAADRIGEGLNHRVLADQLGEILRPVFPRKHAIWRGGGGLLRRFGQVEAQAKRFGFVHRQRFRGEKVSAPLLEVGAGTTRDEIVVAASFRI